MAVISSSRKCEMRRKAKAVGKKLCNKCLLIKERCDFHIKRISNATGKIILQSACKLCKNTVSRNHYYNKVGGEHLVEKRGLNPLYTTAPPSGKKCCNHCGSIKLLGEFYTHGKYKSGKTRYSYICKRCDDINRAKRRKST